MKHLKHKDQNKKRPENIGTKSDFFLPISYIITVVYTII